MKTAIALIVMVLISSNAFAGEEPATMEGHTLKGPDFTNATTAVKGTFINISALEKAGFVNETSVSEADLDRAAEKMEDSLPDGYFTRSMKTLTGTLVRIDTESMTATVQDGSAVIEFTFDSYTVFMKDFKPAQAASFRSGARVVGLFDDSDGELYLGRLVEISKTSSRRYR